MTKEEKIENLKKFVENLEVYDLNFYDEDKNNEAWFGGTVLSFSYKNYKFNLSAVGDNEGVIVIKGNDDYIKIKDRRNQAELGYLLGINGITSDKEIEVICGSFDEEYILDDFEKASSEVKALVYLDYGNWWQIDIEKDNKLIYIDYDDCSINSLFQSEEELKEFLNWIENQL